MNDHCNAVVDMATYKAVKGEPLMTPRVKAPVAQTSGPKTLFPGKDRSRQLSTILTPYGHAAIEVVQGKLAQFAKNAGVKEVSVNDAIEYALRREAKIGLDGMA